MSISGQQQINIGAENEATGSDSLFVAFNKVQNNFSTLFSVASPAVAANANSGVNVTTSGNTVYITNTGVTALTEGTNIVLSSSNGNVTISSTAGGNGGGGTVTSVQLVQGTGIAIGGTNPITSNGNISVSLATLSPNPAGSYTYPSVTVDGYGRITNISNGNSVGSVTSVALQVTGDGLSVANSPITTSGTISIQNTGVTRLNQGPGISLSGSNGNVTISSTGLTSAVTSVGISSTTLSVAGTNPVTGTGTITVDLPTSIPLTGNLTAGNILSNGRLILNGSEDLASGAAANLLVTASYFTTTGAETATLAAGVNGQIKTFMMVGDGGDMVITVTNAAWGGAGTMTFGDVGDACTLQYIASKWFCIGNNGVTFA